MEMNPADQLNSSRSIREMGVEARGFAAADGRHSCAQALATAQRLNHTAKTLLRRARALSATNIECHPNRAGPADEIEPSPIAALLAPAGPAVR